MHVLRYPLGSARETRSSAAARLPVLQILYVTSLLPLTTSRSKTEPQLWRCRRVAAQLATLSAQTGEGVPVLCSSFRVQDHAVRARSNTFSELHFWRPPHRSRGNCVSCSGTMHGRDSLALGREAGRPVSTRQSWPSGTRAVLPIAGARRPGLGVHQPRSRREAEGGVFSPRLAHCQWGGSDATP